MQPKGLAKGLWDDCTSRRRTVTFGSSDSLAATTAPAEPPPITMKSYAIIYIIPLDYAVTRASFDPKIRSANFTNRLEDHVVGSPFVKICTQCNRIYPLTHFSTQ